MDIEARIASLPRATITELVRRSLGHSSAILDRWDVSRIRYRSFIAASAGLYRLGGTAHADGGVRPWSIVLKVIRAADERSASPSALDYWRREPLAYGSGLLAHLPDGLAAPRVFGIDEVAEREVWLWLEDVTDRYAEQWPPARYAVAARHLGIFNGFYATSRPLPTEPWLADGPGRWQAAMGMVTSAAVLSADTWQRPPLNTVRVRPQIDRLHRLPADRVVLLDALSRWPLTLLHRDANRGNLLARDTDTGHAETVVLDWADIGTGALGEELNQFILSPASQFMMDIGQTEELEASALAGYLEGLRAAGWNGDARLVQIGYAASLAVRAGLAARQLVMLLNEAEQEAEVQRWERPIEEIIAQRVLMLDFMLERVAQARSMLAEVPAT